MSCHCAPHIGMQCRECLEKENEELRAILKAVIKKHQSCLMCLEHYEHLMVECDHCGNNPLSESVKRIIDDNRKIGC